MIDRKVWTRFWPCSPFALGAIFIVLSSARPATADQPTTTPEVIEMLQGDISEELIAKKIEVDGCDCAVTPELISGLQAAGASDELVYRLIEISAQVYPGNPVTTPMIIEMLAAEVSEQIIWRNIVAAGCACDTSAQALIGLKQSGASEDFMATLIEMAAEGPTSAEAEPEPAP